MRHCSYILQSAIFFTFCSALANFGFCAEPVAAASEAAQSGIPRTGKFYVEYASGVVELDYAGLSLKDNPQIFRDASGKLKMYFRGSGSKGIVPIEEARQAELLAMFQLESAKKAIPLPKAGKFYVEFPSGVVEMDYAKFNIADGPSLFRDKAGKLKIYHRGAGALEIVPIDELNQTVLKRKFLAKKPIPVVGRAKGTRVLGSIGRTILPAMIAYDFFYVFHKLKDKGPSVEVLTNFNSPWQQKHMQQQEANNALGENAVDGQ